MCNHSPAGFISSLYFNISRNHLNQSTIPPDWYSKTLTLLDLSFNNITSKIVFGSAGCCYPRLSCKAADLFSFPSTSPIINKQWLQWCCNCHIGCHAAALAHVSAPHAATPQAASQAMCSTPLTPTGTLPPEWGYPKEGHESEYPSAFPSLARLAIEGNNISGALSQVHSVCWGACAHLCWLWAETACQATRLHARCRVDTSCGEWKAGCLA